MKVLTAAILSTLAFAAPAERAIPITVPVVDLTLPGAMDALRDSDPDRFRRVLKALEKQSSMPCKYSGPYLVQATPLDPRVATCGVQLYTSYPAKRRVSVWVDATIYEALVTVRDLEAKVQRATPGR